MEKEYKIDNKIQLGKALKYLDSLGYEWNSGRGLTDWKPDTTADDFPITLSTGISGKPNTVTYAQLGASSIDYKPPFDNLLDAPDYSGSRVEECGSEETDAVTEEGQTADEIFSEFLRELSELLGLTEDEELEFDDMPDKDSLPKDDERYEEKDATYTVRLTNGESVSIVGYKGVYDSDFLADSGTNVLTAKELFMYLTGEHVDSDWFTNGRADIRQGLDNIKTIEVDGTHKVGEFESDVRFTVIADGKHVAIDRYSVLSNDYHLFEIPDIYDGNELTFDELLAFITRKGNVDHCDNFKEIQSITVVTPDEEDEEDEADEETLDDTPDESGETKFVIHLTNGSVMWRIPRNAYSDFLGSTNRFDRAGVGFYHEVKGWDYRLNVDELIEALRLIDLSDLANISTVK